MVLQLQLSDILHRLTSSQKPQTVSLHGWQLTLNLIPGEGILISTPVYRGDNFVPLSVREGLAGDPFEGVSHLNTHVSLDAGSFTVTLCYQGSFEELRLEAFNALLEEFSWEAEQWWRYLDDRDKRDLVHIHTK